MPPCLSFPTLCPPFPWGQLGPGQLAATVTHARLARGPAAIPVPVPSRAMGASSCSPPASCWHRSSFPPPFAFFRGFLGFFFQEKPQTRAERIKGLAGAQGTGRGSSGGAEQGPRQPTMPKIGVSSGTRGPAACPVLPRGPWDVAGGKLRHGAVHTRVPMHTCVMSLGVGTWLLGTRVCRVRLAGGQVPSGSPKAAWGVPEVGDMRRDMGTERYGTTGTWGTGSWGQGDVGLWGPQDMALQGPGDTGLVSWERGEGQGTMGTQGQATTGIWHPRG